MHNPKSSLAAIGLLAAVLLSIGCRQDMHDQPKIEPYEANAFFADNQGSRHFPAGTVPRDFLNEDTHLYEGKDDAGEFVSTLPASIETNRELLERGKDRFEIYCTPCHDATGSGRGMIVRRGFKQPKPLYDSRLQGMPIGYFFDVMTQGFGTMSSYGRMIPVEDRWAIAAYIRVLQTSQQALLFALPDNVQEEFHEAIAAAEAAAAAGDGHGDDSHGGDSHGESH